MWPRIVTPEALALVERKVTRLREAHVCRLLSVLNEAIKVIHVERKTTVRESLNLFKDGTVSALNDYATSVQIEVLSVINGTQIILTPEGKASVLATVEKQFDSSLYAKRFRIYEEAFERHVARTGFSLHLGDFRPDLVKASYEVASVNFIRAFLAALSDDLEVIVQRRRPEVPDATLRPEGRLEQANRLFMLEPNFFGLGLNVNYLIRRLFVKRK